MWGRAEGVRADGPRDQGAWERKCVQRWRPAALRRLRARRPRSLAPPAGHRPTSRSPTLNHNSPGWGACPFNPPGHRRPVGGARTTARAAGVNHQEGTGHYRPNALAYEAGALRRQLPLRDGGRNTLGSMIHEETQGSGAPVYFTL